MQSLKRDWAARRRWYDVLRCSSSWDSRAWSAESCCTDSEERSTAFWPAGEDEDIFLLRGLLVVVHGTHRDVREVEKSVGVRELGIGFDTGCESAAMYVAGLTVVFW